MSKNLETKIQHILPDMWREVCDSGTALRFKISSGSMMPFLNVGDIVKVRSIEPSEVSIGDIVAFQDGKHVLVHRIISRKQVRNRWKFRHRGDSSLSSGIFEGRHLIGKVTDIEKAGHEFSLDTRWHTVNNKIIGWRLRITEHVNYRYPRLIRVMFNIVLGPPWSLYRKLLLRRL